MSKEMMCLFVESVIAVLESGSTDKGVELLRKWLQTLEGSNGNGNGKSREI